MARKPKIENRKSFEARIVERTRAAVALTSGDGEAAQLAAFMGIFHPTFDADKTREMVNEARERDRRRR